MSGAPSPADLAAARIQVPVGGARDRDDEATELAHHLPAAPTRSRARLGGPAEAIPLPFAYSTADGRRVEELLVADGVAAAAGAGLCSQRPTAVAGVVQGTAKGIVGSRGLVLLDDGQMATGGGS